MGSTESSRRPWLNLLIIAAIASPLACFTGLKWSESASRKQLLKNLDARGAVYVTRWPERWSIEWPFYNVKTTKDVTLADGKFTDDDVRRLRAAFPGMPIYHVDENSNTGALLNDVRVIVPED